MALTPEDVVNKRFQQTKFREGYDQDEVDDFLDEIVVELRRLTQENEELRAKLDALDARQGGTPALATATATTASAPAVDPVVAPTPVPVSEDVDTTSSNNLLQLARRLHEEHVREGVQKRDELIAEAHETATRMVLEAETTQRAQLKKFEKEKSELMSSISELKSFESEYRQKLHAYISSELANLDAMSATSEDLSGSSAKA
ncbi:MAG: DivIVA domain-containing protein [Actinomycetales bacterium]|nr:DivIVA domain-containing protein [Actinomycetales bacterium]